MVEVNMLPELGSDSPESVLGRWASDTELPNILQDARDVTAVKEEWKKDPVILSLEVTEPLSVNRGNVREVYDEGLDRDLPGGATQIELIEGKESTYKKVEIIEYKDFDDDK